MTGSPTAPQLIELMQAYQAGDLAAFEALYAALAGDVRRYFWNARRDAAIAHDLTQDLFLELHRARRTYTPPLPVRPWVFGIARNVLARSWRAARPADALEVEPALEPRAGDALDVGHALASLPPNAREVWVLHHVLGHSFHAIAQRLGVTVMAAKLRSSRAMRALRATLRGSRDDD